MPDASPDSVFPASVDSGADGELVRLLFTRPWTFVRGMQHVGDLPPLAGTVEVAFAGRSNVGKSSLINALTGQLTFARTSNTPGRTQELNLFRPEADLGPDTGLFLVDMPGYGYAEAPKAKVDAWNGLIRDYLRGRPNLRRVFLLVDARHGVKKNDEEVMKMLDKSAVSYQVVLTKADKLKPGELDRVISATHAAIGKRPAAHPDVLASSAEKRQGLEAIRAAIAAIAHG